MRATSFAASLLLASALVGCSSSRVERYYTPENAPSVTVEQAGTRAQLLYFKQSMRHFYATVRLTNVAADAVVFQRVADGAAQVLLEAEGQRFTAEPPTHTSWTPWTGAIEQTKDQITRLELAPGTAADISLRWEFPTTLSNYQFDWAMVFHGLVRGGAAIPDVVLHAPKG